MSRPRPTTVDYVVIAISPALVMTLVGSLAFFLIRVFYQGQHSTRLQYILALFVFAAVLISRISIESGKGRAVLFGLPLAIATGLAMLRFAETRGPLADMSGLLHLLLIGVIWWCTHKLTHDCTVLDESKVQTEQGLLQYMGLDGRREGPLRAPEDRPPTDRPPPLRRIAAWWKQLAHPQRKRQTHGVWVVYFSLAALPLFGFGQLFIPASDAAGRRYVFILLAIYLLSGFGLLVTTSLISLRQYLRQRNLLMPNSMVKTWIGAGVLLAIAVLAVVWILPRSVEDFGVTKAPLLGSRDDRETSDLALGSDGNQHDPQATRVNDQLEGGEATRDSQDGGDGSGGKAEKDRAGRPQDKQGNSNGNGKASADQQDAQGTNRQEQRQASSASSEEANSPNGDSRPQHSQGDQSLNNPDAGRPASSEGAKEVLQSVFNGIWNLLKYLVYVLLAAISIFLAWKYRNELRSAWRELLAELRDLWNRLRGRRRTEASTADHASAAEDKTRLEPFASFNDPFLTDAAAKMSAEQLVRYSFLALEAWSREQAVPRDPQDTPTEFTHCVSERFEALRGELHDLCDMYCRAAYASQEIPKGSAMKLNILWRKMANLAEVPNAKVGDLLARSVSE